MDDSWTESILHITITAKTAEEMMTQYRFSVKQKTMLDELLENRDALLELIGDLQYISADAEIVMRHLPDNLSDERRKVVKTACSLVGKINYFWGGKSLVIGWDPAGVQFRNCGRTAILLLEPTDPTDLIAAALSIGSSIT